MQSFWTGRVKRAEMTRDVHNRTVRYAGERMLGQRPFLDIAFCRLNPGATTGRGFTYSSGRGFTYSSGRGSTCLARSASNDESADCENLRARSCG